VKFSPTSCLRHSHACLTTPSGRIEPDEDHGQVTIKGPRSMRVSPATKHTPAIQIGDRLEFEGHFICPVTGQCVSICLFSDLFHEGKS
jgi:hypothetical protein